MIKCEKNECFKDKFYTDKVGSMRTNIYKLLTENNNEYLATVIEEFITTWNDITFAAVTPIAQILKTIYENLQFG